MQKINEKNTALATFFVATAVVLIGGLAVSVIQQTAFAQPTEPHKVTICHIPPGNPAERHTITVDESAVAAHVIEHGDYIGPCQPSPDS
jgi:hypothetical protein